MHDAAFCIVRDHDFTAGWQKLLQCHVVLRADPVLMRKLHSKADNKATFVEWPAILWHSFIQDASYITRPYHLTYSKQVAQLSGICSHNNTYDTTVEENNLA